MSEIKSDDRARRSPGPTSSLGKQVSSRNAATHGLSCEKFFLLPNEKQEDFDALAQSLADEYQEVDSPGLQPLLKTLVEALWLQNRAYKKVFESEYALATAESNGNYEDAEKIFKRLLLMQRYKTSYENSYQRAFRTIEAYRKNRLATYIAEVRLEKTMHSTANDRLDLYDRFLEYGKAPDEAWMMMKEMTPLSQLTSDLPHALRRRYSPYEPPAEPQQNKT